jgi:hypothetical protein
MNLMPETKQIEPGRDEWPTARGPEATSRGPKTSARFYTLLGICALLLLSLGLLGAWCLRELDLAYTHVINHAARRFSMLQNLGENLAVLDTKLKVDLLSQRAPKTSEFQNEIVQLEAQNKALLRELEPFVDDPYFKAGLDELRAREKSLGEACRWLTALLATGDLAAANTFRLEPLLPQVENTRAAVRKLNRMITDHMLQVGNETTDKADRLTKLVAGLGALPIAFGAALCLLMISILTLLAWQLRQDHNMT